jgi:hypothetical protein
VAIEEQTARTVFKGDGSTRAFPVTWYLDAEENTIVKMTNVTTAQVKTLELGTDYTVTPSDGEYPTNGAVINYPKNSVTPALGSDYRLTVIRNVPYTQNFVFPNNTRLLPKNIEGGLDGLELQIQQINDKADNAVSIPAGMDYDNEEFVAELFDKAKSAEQSAINAKASEANAKSSATNASQSAQTATTKAQEAKASATSASQSAQTATTKANEAKASATSASQSAQTATTKANEAKASATSASQSAQTATTKAQEAISSATSAKKSETNAKASATNAKESEDKALDYAERAEQASGSVGNPVSDVVVEDNKITVTKGVGGSTEYTVNNVENAVKATQDSQGKTINTTYLKLSGGTLTGDLNVSGHNITAKKITGNIQGVSTSSEPFPQNNFREVVFGSATEGDFLKPLYSKLANGYGTPTAGISWGKANAQGFLQTYHGAPPTAIIGGGAGTNGTSDIDWYRQIAFTESPTFIGAPTAPTPSTSDNSTKLATTAFVRNQKYLQRKDTVNVQSLDFNSYTSDGMYNYGGTFTNSYGNRSVFGTLVVLNNLYNGGSGTTGTYISQTAHDADGDIYVRYRNGTDNWSAWRKFLKEPTRTVLMDTWIDRGDIKLSESWRNFDELVFAGTDDSKANLDFKYIKTADLANWLADSSYPPTLHVVVVGYWMIQRNGTTDTLLKVHSENAGIAKVIGIKY